MIRQTKDKPLKSTFGLRILKLFFRKRLLLLMGLILVYLILCSLFNSSFVSPDVQVSFSQLHQQTESVKKQLQTFYTPQDDIIYISEAFGLDEEEEDLIYRFTDKVENGVSFPHNNNSVVSPSLPHIDELEYSAYEEELPQDISEDDVEASSSVKTGYFVYQNHKNIKDIKLDVRHKPPYFGEEPLLAIVIDDMGINQKRTKEILSLKAPLTSSFLTYSSHLKKQILQAKEAGHEIMAHIPMEAQKNKDVAPVYLQTTMSPSEIETTLIKFLQLYPEIKGINNHMGSAFTEDAKSMQSVMNVIQPMDLYFLDSKTSAHSVGKKVALNTKVPYAGRHVFLDNKNDLSYIQEQLKIAEKIAHKRGYAVAICHPKTQTFEALKIWLSDLESKKIKLVHLSEIVKILNQPSDS